MYYATLQNKKKKSSKGYIPRFFEFDLSTIQEHVLVMKQGDSLQMFITPLLRTVLCNMSSFSNIRGQEHMAKLIKERMDYNSRRLIKNSSLKSRIVEIKGKQYVSVNANIKKSENTDKFLIMNDNFEGKTHLV